MTFINPIEILKLKDTDISKIDTSVIKRAKRQLQAEIELSNNGYLVLDQQNITKTDAERVISDLDNQDKKEFYYFIANNNSLNEFLKSGDESFFHNFRQESIYKLQSFVDFISPYFFEKYDKSLLKAFKRNDEILIKKILSIQILLQSNNQDQAFKGVYNEIKNRIKELDKITSEIKSGKSDYNENNIGKGFDWVKSKFNATTINLLPQYFQSVRSQVAQSVRNFSVNTFNAFGDSQLSLNIIDYALCIDIDDIKKQNLSEDRKQLNEINERYKREEKDSVILKKYAAIVISIKNKINEIERVDTTAYYVGQWFSNNITIAEIKELKKEYSEIRDQIAMGLRAMSVAVWNKFNDVNLALRIIYAAIVIVEDPSKKAGFIEDEKQLSEIKRKVDIYKTSTGVNSQQNPKNTAPPITQVSSKPSTNNNQGCLVLVGIVIIIGIIIAISNANKSDDSYKYNSSNSLSYNDNNNLPVTDTAATAHTDLSSNTDAYTTTDTAASYIPSQVIESPYKGNQLKNGSSPFSECFGGGSYGGKAWIEFINSNQSDAIVCLVDVSSDETIRNEYIQAGTTFKMTKIPTGTYYLKIYYGNDWNPTKENFCGTKGAFESDVSFSKSDNYSDRIDISNTDFSYTAGSITLYAVTGGNMSSQTTTESDFFKK